MTARTEAERVAVLEEQIKTLKIDFENVAQKHRDSTDDLEKKIEALEKKVFRYECITGGVVSVFAFILWVFEKAGMSISNVVASVFSSPPQK